MEVFKGSDLNEIIEQMFARMRTQIENPALVNSRFVFDQVLFLDISFHKLKLTRGSSYLPLPGRVSNKKAVINLQNEEDEECFKWAVITHCIMKVLICTWNEYQISGTLRTITSGENFQFLLIRSTFSKGRMTFS